jgi:hypothetical protein
MVLYKDVESRDSRDSNKLNESDDFSKKIIQFSGNAGRLIKQSSIPDMICGIAVGCIQILKILDEIFNLYDNTLFLIQSIAQFLLYSGTLGTSSLIEFLKAYHQVKFYLDNFRLKEIRRKIFKALEPKKILLLYHRTTYDYRLEEGSLKPKNHILKDIKTRFSQKF